MKIKKQTLVILNVALGVLCILFKGLDFEKIKRFILDTLTILNTLGIKVAVN